MELKHYLIEIKFYLLDVNLQQKLLFHQTKAPAQQITGPNNTFDVIQIKWDSYVSIFYLIILFLWKVVCNDGNM